MQTRRHFLTSSAALGTITLLPYAAMAAAHSSDTYETAIGTVTVHPISHASIVIETPAGVIYVDPVGEASLYADLPAADLILITHEHGDHYNADTLAALTGDAITLITNPAVLDCCQRRSKPKPARLPTAKTRFGTTSPSTRSPPITRQKTA